jgi:hypothetical protein
MAKAKEEKKKEEGAESGAKPEEAKSAEINPELFKMLQGISEGLTTISSNVSDLTNRVHKIETGGKEEFKAHAKSEDVEKAKAGRKDVDPRIIAIVDEILGEDFMIDLKPNKDRPGYLFSLIVPTRLSGNEPDKRPIRDPAKPGEYLKDASGMVIVEDYTPEDRRSRMLSGLDNFDTIRQHCERVRSFIVSYFQKVSKPLPEFKVK